MEYVIWYAGLHFRNYSAGLVFSWHVTWTKQRRVVKNVNLAKPKRVRKRIPKVWLEKSPNPTGVVTNKRKVQNPDPLKTSEAPRIDPSSMQVYDGLTFFRKIISWLTLLVLRVCTCPPMFANLGLEGSWVPDSCHKNIDALSGLVRAHGVTLKKYISIFVQFLSPSKTTEDPMMILRKYVYEFFMQQ
jgi:hypothetical protein